MSVQHEPRRPTQHVQPVAAESVCLQCCKTIAFDPVSYMWSDWLCFLSAAWRMFVHCSFSIIARVLFACRAVVTKSLREWIYDASELFYMSREAVLILGGLAAAIVTTVFLVGSSIFPGQRRQGGSAQSDEDARNQVQPAATQTVPSALPTRKELELNHKFVRQIRSIEDAIKSGRGDLQTLVNERQKLLEQANQHVALVAIATRKYELACDLVERLAHERERLADRWNRGDTSVALEQAIHSVDRELSSALRELHRSALDVT